MKTAAVLLTGLLGGLLALTGCNNPAKPDPAAGTAQGEILPGSVSDAMLPLDTVKSQAPLAPGSEGGAAGLTRPPANASAKSIGKSARSAIATPPDAADLPAPVPAAETL